MSDPKRTILIADDEEELAFAVKVRLEAEGFQVICAKNGQEALDIALERKPDLIMLDVLMPVMDGYACLRKINEQLGRGVIPVIVLTVRDYMKDLFELEGVDDYMIKPFDHEELLLRIQNIFKRRSQ